MSLKGDNYETMEEIRFRLQDSVVLYDHKPVYINQVSNREAEDGKEIARVYFLDIPFKQGAKATRKFLSSIRFDLTPFKMGYMNFPGEALYLTRTPIRQQRQGLTSETLHVSDIDGRSDKRYLLPNVCVLEGFNDMVFGKYPTLKDSLDMIGDGKTSSVAVSRQFALEFDHNLEIATLMHKFNRCGVVRKNERGVKLPPKFQFLKEELEECRIPCL